MSRHKIILCDCCNAEKTEAGIVAYKSGGYEELCVNCLELANHAFVKGKEKATEMDGALRACVHGMNILAHMDEGKVKEMIGTQGLEVLQAFKKALESMGD